MTRRAGPLRKHHCAAFGNGQRATSHPDWGGSRQQGLESLPTDAVGARARTGLRVRAD